MKILIIEDEAPAARRLQNLILEIIPDALIVGVLDSIQSSVEWFQNNTNPDLILSDIQLADGLSFEIFQKIKMQTPVIFITAYDEYSIQAFKLNSIDYLLKPIDKSELEAAIKKYSQLKSIYGHTRQEVDLQKILSQLQNEKKYKNRFLVKLGDKLESVPEEQIAYFLSEDKLTMIVTTENKKYPIDYSLDELEDMVNPKNFFRINRQFIAKISSIKSVHNYFNGKLKLILEPDFNKIIVVSREKASELKDWLDGK